MNRLIASLTVMMALSSSAFCQEEGFTLINAPRGNLYNLGPTGLWGYGSKQILDLLAVGA